MLATQFRLPPSSTLLRHNKPYILTPNVCPHVDWGWRGKRSRKRDSCLSWKLRPTGRFGLSNSNSTNLHASENISLQTCTERLSAIFPHNTGLKLIQFRKTRYQTAVRINAVHIIYENNQQDAFTHSQALQPMQGLGRLKKSPPTISILGLPLPIWLPASLHPSSLHPSIWGLAFPLAFCPPACPRWFSYMVEFLAFVLYVLPIWAWLS